MTRQAVILAGGLATRMQPRTLTVPKSLLDVGGRPFIFLQLELLAQSGFDEVVLCVAHLGEQIRERVGNAYGGVKIRYSEEGPNLLGTGGAVRAALPILQPTFVVTYGDSYLPFDYGDLLDALDDHDDCDAVMSVFRNGGQWEASNVRLSSDGAWISAYEKTRTSEGAFDYIDYGALACRRKVFEAMPEKEAFGLDTVQTRLASARRLRAWVARERFYEIGSPEGFAALEQRLAGATK